VGVPLQLGAMEREDTDLASVAQLMDCAILSEWAMDKELPDRWWRDAFDSREKAGGPWLCPPDALLQSTCNFSHESTLHVSNGRWQAQKPEFPSRGARPGSAPRPRQLLGADSLALAPHARQCDACTGYGVCGVTAAFCGILLTRRCLVCSAQGGNGAHVRQRACCGLGAGGSGKQQSGERWRPQQRGLLGTAYTLQTRAGSGRSRGLVFGAAASGLE
jgi:hypothetical protein